MSDLSADVMWILDNVDPDQEPDWMVGGAAYYRDVLPYYKTLVAPYRWNSGLGVIVPAWALQICRLSKEGRDPRLPAWIAWCAAGGKDASTRAHLLLTAARTMKRDDALAAIEGMVRSG